jgi:hypothetical protein
MSSPVASADLSATLAECTGPRSLSVARYRLVLVAALRVVSARAGVRVRAICSAVIRPEYLAAPPTVTEMGGCLVVARRGPRLAGRVRQSGMDADRYRLRAEGPLRFIRRRARVQMAPAG